MKEIELTRGMAVKVDDEDFEKFKDMTWYAHRKAPNRKSYARTCHKPMRYMHRLILNVTDPKVQVDHINGDTLDNRKENLRLATNQQNSRNLNKLKSNNTTGFRGVYYRSKGRFVNRWAAQITLPTGEKKHLGQFRTAEEAARAFDDAAKELCGEFCGQLNLE